jgi:hypothetical protein
MSWMSRSSKPLVIFYRTARRYTVVRTSSPTHLPRLWRLRSTTTYAFFEVSVCSQHALKVTHSVVLQS